MGRFAFWCIAVLLLAATTHLAVVLFTPGISMESIIGRVFTTAPLNSMVVLEADATPTILREANPDLVYAVCPYDISVQPLSISTKIPEFYWSISIYSDRGDNVYTLNDQQAGVSALDFRLELEPPTLDLTQLVASDEEEEATKEAAVAAADNIVHLETPTERGVVLLRAFLPDPAYRSRVTAALQASSCAPAAAETPAPAPAAPSSAPAAPSADAPAAAPKAARASPQQ
ncbi:putative membrane protein [Rhodoligotrophos appendicifer]|uniref:DUF1254 domain-containing protein n=1 Tax=Rhodoligotrophos appendicifer TaxID=987056 RepID=UPI001185C1A9|nr:DUF1254 domain-containing protein [Rhodoligotrophos appendicifer]